MNQLHQQFQKDLDNGFYKGYPELDFDIEVRPSDKTDVVVTLNIYEPGDGGSWLAGYDYLDIADLREDLELAAHDYNKVFTEMEMA